MYTTLAWLLFLCNWAGESGKMGHGGVVMGLLLATLESTRENTCLYML